MSWTYSGDPANSDLDAVRFKIGDTDTTDQLLQDEEINYLLTTKGSVISAAVDGCKQLWTKFARQVTKEMGPLKIYYSDRAKAFKELYTALAKEAIGYSGPNIDVDALPDDQSTHEAIFTIGMMDDYRHE